MELIGLSGWAGAGKDSMADLLVARHGWTKVAFADTMRAAALAINPIIDWGSDGRPVTYRDALDRYGYTEMKERFPEARRFLQRLGTEFGRGMLGEYFWVDLAFSKIPKDTNLVVFTDVRFKNEARAIRDRGGLVVRIERPGVGPANDHISEHDLDDWVFDHVIQNNSSLRDLALFASYLDTQAELNRAA